jgi:hypothetical protein
MPPRIWALVWTAMATACLGDFESTPAYEEQEFLCGAADAAAWQALIDACRADSASDPTACGGVMSIEGTLAGDPVRATSRFSSSTFVVAELPEGRTLERVDANGNTPYFSATLTWYDLGGAADSEPAPQREVAIVEVRGEALRDGDVATAFSLRASDAVSSRGFAAKSGTLHVTTQTARELAGDFDARFETPGDSLKGCFHVLAERVRSGEP